MSVFEIVRGVEGDCLVLDGTRICGPKPWGGGRIIKTFHTDGIYEVIDKDEYHKLQAENAKLRELVDYMTPIAFYEASERERADMRKLGGGRMTGCAILDGDIAARKNGKRFPCESLQAENAKLRELAKKLVIFAFARCADCDLLDASCTLVPTQKCLLWNECESAVRELGIEVPDAGDA